MAVNLLPHTMAGISIPQGSGDSWRVSPVPHHPKDFIGCRTISSTSLSLPHLHGLIFARRGDAVAIGRPGDRCHTPMSMPLIGEDVTSLYRIPDLHGLVSARRGDAPPIG